MDPWEEKLRYAADHPGELTDWDVHYDTLEKMTMAVIASFASDAINVQSASSVS